MFSLFSLKTAVSVVALASYAAAQAAVNTPTSLIQCQPYALSESTLGLAPVTPGGDGVKT
jgi:hypothetical protein